VLSLLGGALLIFLARVTDVSLATLRMLFLVRGKRYYAGGIGFLEVIIYIMALKYVVDRLHSPLNLVFYALGFAAGNVVGSFIEEKVALGQVTLQVITDRRPLELAQRLRSLGLGVTVTHGLGLNGRHYYISASPERS